MQVPEKWTYVLKPVTPDYMIQAIQTKVEVGQKITIKWDFADLTVPGPHNRWMIRCIGCGLDGVTQASYWGEVQSGIASKGEETHEVTYAGNILFGGYTVGLTQNNSVIAKYIKVLIENPEE